MTTTSKFLAPSKTYIEEAAKYLDARGLTIQELPIVTHKTVNLGFEKKVDGVMAPLILEGWAFQIRGPEGDYYDDRWLLRVCNWPEGDIFQKRGGKTCQVTGRPKFIQVSMKGADCTNYVSTVDEMCHAPVVMWHEKYTSAALTKKLLNIPSIALSGCTNWSSEGKLRDSLADMVRLMQLNSKIVVCFDGDILENPNVMHAASQLKGWINTIRDDIEVVFPLVPPMPEGMNGWDDFTVSQGEEAQQAWLEMLSAKGVDVSAALPVQHMVSKYQVKVKVLKDKVVVEHTPENYRRLLAHPLWTDYAMDTGGAIYNIKDIPLTSMSFDDLARRYEAWLADVPFVGDGSNVASGKVKGALREEMLRRMVSMPLYLLGQRPQVTQQQAQDAAKELITKGLKVTGPMTEEQTIETVIRMARDMVAMWSADRNVDVQWVWSLVGPSGCGKSNFPKSFTKCLDDWGLRAVTSQLAKEGPKSNIDELYRQTRDSLVGVFDEYNPAESSARIVEQNLFTLSSTRMFTQRRLHEEDAREAMRRSSLFLTTVDRNCQYMRSSKGAGGERRFITMEVEGVQQRDGIMTSNREVIARCGETLLVYGYQLYTEGHTGDATQYSQALSAKYIGDAPLVARMAALWAKMDMQKVLDNFGEEQKRKTTGDVRFSLPQIQQALVPDERLGRMDQADLRDFIMQLGAEDIGKGRVNTPSGETMKDKVYMVKDWPAWCQALRAKL